MSKLIEIKTPKDCPFYDEHADPTCCHNDGPWNCSFMGIIPNDCPLPDAPSESQKVEVVQNCPKCGKHGDAQEFYSGGGYKAYTCNGCKTVWPVGINE